MIEMVFILIDEVVVQLCVFYLVYFVVQYGIFRGVVVFEVNFMYVIMVVCVDVNVQFNGFIVVVDFWL